MVCRIGADPVFFAARDFAFRRLAREAEGAPLLREYGVKSSIEGSNPSVSATRLLMRLQHVAIDERFVEPA